MTAMKKLTTRQETFARLVASGSLSNTEAARQAGYRHPDRLGHRLRKVAAVQELIVEIRSSNRSPAEALEDHLQMLDDLCQEAVAAGQYMAAVKAQIAIGRALGFYDRSRPMMVTVEPTLAEAELAERIIQRLQAHGLAVVADEGG